MKTTRLGVLLALVFMIFGCQQDSIQVVDQNIEQNEKITFRNDCDLGDLAEIAEALRDEINDLMEPPSEVFNNPSANGLLPLLNNLDKLLDMLKCEEAQLLLDEDIIPHLLELNEEGVLPDDIYEELDDIAHGTPPCRLCSEVAREQIKERGWFVGGFDAKAGIMFGSIDGRLWYENCSSCMHTLYFVWKDYTGDPICLESGPYNTWQGMMAGYMYAGHSPCACDGDNIICGSWDMQNCIPD